MVMGSMRDPPEGRKPWATIVRRTVVFAAAWGGLIGWLCDSWLAGLISAGAVLALPVLSVVVSAFWGLYVIPLTILTLKALGFGVRCTGDEHDRDRTDTVAGPRPGTPAETPGDR